MSENWLGDTLHRYLVAAELLEVYNNDLECDGKTKDTNFWAQN